jgi:hypothetical protein
MRKLSLWQVCLEEEDGVSSHVCIEDINIMKKEKIKCKFRMIHLKIDM